MPGFFLRYVKKTEEEYHHALTYDKCVIKNLCVAMFLFRMPGINAIYYCNRQVIRLIQY